MNLTQKSAFVLLSCFTLLSGCGGGGDDNAGSLTTFSIVPSEIKWSGPPGACAANATSRVYVHGGAAPYRLQNTLPDGISVDKTEVDNRNDYFEVTVLGMCMDQVEVAVLDANDRRVVLTVTNEEGEEN